MSFNLGPDRNEHLVQQLLDRLEPDDGNLDMLGAVEVEQGWAYRLDGFLAAHHFSPLPRSIVGSS